MSRLRSSLAAAVSGLMVFVRVTAAADLVPSDLAFRISPAGVEASVGGRPAMAAGPAHFLVGYQLPNASGGMDIWAARVTHAGVLADPNGIAVATNLNTNGDRAQQLPSVVFDGTNFILAWTEDRGTGYELYAARVTQGGTVLDPGGVRLTEGAEPLRAPGIAFDGTNLLIVWREGPSSPPFGVWGLIVSPSFSIVAGASRGFSISATGRYPWAAFDGTNYLVVWHDERNTETTGLDIYAARVSQAGSVLDPNGILVCNAAGDQDHSSVAFNGSTYLAAWFDERGGDRWNGGSAWAARISTGGTVTDPGGFKIGDYTSNQPPVVATRFGDGFLVAWQYGHGFGDYRLADAVATRVTVDGTVVDTPPVMLGGGYGHEWAPTVAATGTTVIATWNESLTERCNEECVAAMIVTDVPGDSPPPDSSAQSAPIARPDDTGWESAGPATNEHLNVVWAFDPNNVWVTGSNFGVATIFKFDGSTWASQLSFDWRFFGLWGTTPADVWAVGWCGGTYQSSGAAWTPSPHCSGTPVGMSIWGASRSEFHFVTAGGAARRYRNGSWTFNLTGVVTDLRDLWGTSESNVYAVGARGHVLHWNGSDWSPVAGIPTTNGLNAIWGTSESDIFAVGDGGVILHYNGATWAQQSSGTFEDLNGVWGFDAGHVYAVGQHGKILRYDSNAWSAESSGTTENLNDVMAVGTQVWAVGDGGKVLRKTVTRPPRLRIIDRLDPHPTAESTVRFAVQFDATVTGVDLTDFTLTTSGVAGAAKSSVSGTGANYVVTVTTGSGASGTIRLDLTDDDSISASGLALGGTGAGNGNMTGPTYTISRSLPAPTSLVATAIPTNDVALSWNPSAGATQYEVWRLNHGVLEPVGAFPTTSFSDHADVGKSYVYRVRASAPGYSPFSNGDLATITFFNDEPLQSGTTIKLQHMTQLRAATNALCAAAGIASPVSPTLTTTISASHVSELRTGLNSAMAALGLPVLPFTDPVLTSGVTPIKAIHMQEIRDRLK